MERLLIKILPALLLVFALAPAALAQREKPVSTTANSLFKIPVWVEKGDGKFWKEAKRQSFKVLLGDKEVPIRSIQGPRNSTIILVVFDTVGDLARVDQARLAL